MATVLVIEDSDNFRGLLRRALARSGYTVEEAPNGVVAMKLFAEKGIDLVITDLNMPDQDGIETIQRIRERNEEIPIIAISGSIEVSLEDAMLLGANMRLAKPFTIDDMLAAVRVMLSEDLGEEETG